MLSLLRNKKGRTSLLYPPLLHTSSGTDVFRSERSCVSSSCPTIAPVLTARQPKRSAPQSTAHLSGTLIFLVALVGTRCRRSAARSRRACHRAALLGETRVDRAGAARSRQAPQFARVWQAAHFARAGAAARRVCTPASAAAAARPRAATAAPIFGRPRRSRPIVLIVMFCTKLETSC